MGLELVLFRRQRLQFSSSANAGISLLHTRAIYIGQMARAHFVSSTLEDLQSSHAMRFLCKYAKPLAASKATCLPLHTHTHRHT